MDPLLAHLVEAAGRAPSAHNTQPWLLQWRESELLLRVAEHRMLRVADPEGFDILYALGTLLENLMLTLGQLGFEGEYLVPKKWDLSKPLVVLRWHPRKGVKPDPRLYRMIPIRRTSRRVYFDEPIPAAVLEDIRRGAMSPAKLYVLTDTGAKDEIRSLAAASSAQALQDRSYAAELYGWMRFSRKDPGWHRDGLNAECMGWHRIEAALVRQLLKPAIAAFLSKSRWTRWFYANTDQQAPFAPALCLLTTRDSSTAGRVEAGRNLQRVWLTAASHGLVTHPLSAAVDDPKSLQRVFEIFGVPPGETHVNLFRLGKCPKTARSERLPADELLEPYA
jgi:nitroreductase